MLRSVSSHTQIENIDACLSFLAAKGVNIQGLSAEGKAARAAFSIDSSLTYKLATVLSMTL